MRWTISKITQTFACSLITGLFAGTLSATTVASPSDVRVLVDVSGSMKKADPKAVRGPATALLAALLPDQSKGGIWLFGSDVRELVPYGPVDARWDALGKPIEASIGSTDRFTHMESALRTGITAGGDQPTGACHVILITDGIVDVQGGKDASSASRDRILKTVLPNATDKDCRIHTIALSDKADLPLLRQMAIQTNGLFTLLDQPGDLIPVMLDALELALRSQQLPIRNQEIQIDSDIRQVRLIRLGSDTPIALRSTNKTIDAKKQSQDVSYYSGTGYQTLIWTNPIPGRYTLTEQFGPTDRIMIDSDVRLELGELPPTISADQTLGLSASILKQGTPVNADNREYFVAFGANMDPLRSKGNSLTMQIDSPQIGRSILTIQGVDGAHERQVQRAFEVLEARPAMEIGSGTSQGVGQVASTIPAQQADPKVSTRGAAKLLPETVTNQLPEEMRDWPLWQLIASALGAIALVALVIGLILRPKHLSRE
jgi:hypothetical protein